MKYIPVIQYLLIGLTGLVPFIHGVTAADEQFTDPLKAAAGNRIATNYTDQESYQDFATALISFDAEFYATQTHISSIEPDDTTAMFPRTQLEAFSAEYKPKVVNFIATQTYITNAARESLLEDVSNYLELVTPTATAAVNSGAGFLGGGVESFGLAVGLGAAALFVNVVVV